MNEMEEENLGYLLLRWQKNTTIRTRATSDLLEEARRLNGGQTNEVIARAEFAFQDARRADTELQDELRILLDRSIDRSDEQRVARDFRTPPGAPRIAAGTRFTLEGIRGSTRSPPPRFSEGPTPSWVPAGSVRIGKDKWLAPDGTELSSGRR